MLKEVLHSHKRQNTLTYSSIKELKNKNIQLKEDFSAAKKTIQELESDMILRQNRINL